MSPTTDEATSTHSQQAQQTAQLQEELAALQGEVGSLREQLERLTTSEREAQRELIETQDKLTEEAQKLTRARRDLIDSNELLTELQEQQRVTLHNLEVSYTNIIIDAINSGRLPLAERLCAVEHAEALVDRARIPQAPVLVGEEHELAVGRQQDGADPRVRRGARTHRSCCGDRCAHRCRVVHLGAVPLIRGGGAGNGSSTTITRAR
mgnify:CR=1 FL=1